MDFPFQVNGHIKMKKMQNLQMLEPVPQDNPKLKQKRKCFRGKLDVST